MRIIISPAKKMRQDTDSIGWESLPHFINKADTLYHILQGMSYGELKKLWQCNETIAALNWERLQTLDLHTSLTPAVLAYDGIQYQHMAPGVFTEAEFAYVQEHLRILSGLYGVLRPFDGVAPYRLEMQAKLKTDKGKTLYEYWGAEIAEYLWGETACVVNLAAKEYSLCISRWQPANTRLITCVFGEEREGRVIEKGTLCKMARGEMVRYLAENQVEDPEEMKAFSRMDYHFSPAYSDASTYTFLHSKAKAAPQIW